MTRQGLQALKAGLRVAIDAQNQLEEFEGGILGAVGVSENNSIVRQIDLFEGLLDALPNDEPVTFSAGYADSWTLGRTTDSSKVKGSLGSPALGVGLDFGATATIDRSGARGVVRGRLPFTIFGETVELCRHGHHRVQRLELRAPGDAHDLELDRRRRALPRRDALLACGEEMRLFGMLALHVTAADADGVSLALQLFGLDYELSGRANPEGAARLSLPFVAAFGRDGRPREFRFSTAVGAQESEQLAELVRAFSIVIPQGSSEHWTTREEHALGLFEADYATDGSSAGVRVLKHKLRYLRPSASIAAMDGGQVSLLLSNVEARVGGDGPWVERVQVEEETRVTSGKGMEVTASMHARLEALAQPPDAGLALFSERSSAAVLAAADAQGRAVLAPFPDPEPGEADHAALRALVARLEAGEDRLSLVQEIAALLRRFPALAALVPEMLDESVIQDRTASKLLLALELAAVPHAQAALRTVIDDPRRADMNRLRAIVALGSVPDPSEESIARLWELWAERGTRAADDLSNTAVLGLGRLAASLRTSDPARYAGLRGELVAALGAARDPAQEILALKALANTTDASLAGTVSGYLDSDEADVRKTAATALSGMDRPETRALLAQHLASESDPWARAALATSLTRLGDVPREALDAANQRTASEADPTARLALVELLGTNVERYPEARSTLAGLLQTEKDRHIRAAAAEGLARLQEIALAQRR